MRVKKNTKLKKGMLGIFTRLKAGFLAHSPQFVRQYLVSSTNKKHRLSKHAPKHMRLGVWLHNRRLRLRAAYLGLALLVGFSVVSQIMMVLLIDKNYTLSPKARMVIGESNAYHGQILKYDPKTNSYEYNQGYQAGAEIGGNSTQPRFSASFSSLPEKGVKVSDPATQTSMTFKPKFGVAAPRQTENRLLYPIKGQDAVKVYTLQTIGLKEDIVVNSNSKNDLKYTYQLELEKGTEARLEKDGSIGVYGVSQMLLGNVSTGTEKDAKLLEDARQNAAKENLLYTIPPPIVAEFDKTVSQAKAWFTLEDNELTVHATNLKSASYPLSIDPSVYIETAAKLMRGNNETNIDFDINQELIQKGKTTGARFNEWTSTMDLNEGRWNHGTAVAGGYIYSVGGSKSNVALTTYTSAGNDTYVVPVGVTSITVRLWGAGGGGGGGGDDSTGGDGGGGGFVQTTLAVTPGETLTIRIGGGGGGGVGRDLDNGDGGGGGGHTEIERSGSTLALAAGGGGGGGGDEDNAAHLGGGGGAGGGASGVAGSASGPVPGGGGGTAGAGGAGGNGSMNDGTSGASETGGLGADGQNSTSGGDGGANNGGVATGGDGGLGSVTDDYAGGGGGGSGLFGGGGGAGSTSNGTSGGGGGGGGGGSSYATGTSSSLTAGSGTSPGNANDPLRGTAGLGGDGGIVTAAGTAGNPGKLVISYTAGGDANTTEKTVTWAKLSTTSNVIQSPNPGAGSCGNWCEDNAYDLPDERKGLSLVAYNGFLYAIGGIDDAGNYTNTVYVAKLGINGEPSKWHPTDTNKDNWVYWYASTNLSSNRAYTAAAAYNNRLYLLGGETSSGTSVATAQYADINPDGRLGSWTTVTSLPSARYGHGVQVYNGYLYLLGGRENGTGTMLDAVRYIKINSDGTLVSSWATGNTFQTGRMSWGGNFTTIYGGYIYLMGGCQAVNGSGFCTGVSSDVQLASINADGSIGQWDVVDGLANARIGFGLVAWKNALYRIGGCSSQSSTTGNCLNSVSDNDYGAINADGDLSNVSISETSGVGNCTGGDPYDCDLPPLGDDAGELGQMMSPTAILNGYLYVIAGCATFSGTECEGGSDGWSDNIGYAAISSDGTLRRPPSCVNSYYGSWCVDTTNTINGGNGIGATVAAVFEGHIYVAGGNDESGNGVDDIYSTGVNVDGSLQGNFVGQDIDNLGMSGQIAFNFAYTRANPAAADTYPGNFYIFGGCGTFGLGPVCSGYRTQVYKCNILPNGLLEEADANDCTTTGQLQIDAELSDETDQGLGLMAGAVYANYIYLIGGSSTNESDRDTIIYAKFDDNNNVVSVDTNAAGGNNDDWKVATGEMSTGRQYGAGFGYNGYLYVMGGFSGGGGNSLELAKINVSTGNVEAFSSSTVDVSQRWGLSVQVSNSYVYIIGGCDTGAPPNSCSGFEESLQTLQIHNNESGTPDGYTSAGSGSRFATDRFGASSAIYNGYIYIAGGCTTTNASCTTATASVEYAPLNDDGTVGTWASTTSLGGAGNERAFGQLEVAGGSLYFIGGQNSGGTAQTTVYYGTPASNGTVSSWTAATNGLPAARTEISAAVWNDRIFVTGGIGTGTGCTGGVCNTVYVSPQQSSGGNITTAWDSRTAFDVPRKGHTTIAYANNLYVLGGMDDGDDQLSDVQYTQINADGTLDAWTFTTSLPQALYRADGFAANGYMYLFGGQELDLTCNRNTYVAPISANTVIDPDDLPNSNLPTGLGEWFVTNQRFNTERSSAAAAYNKGKAYVLGGSCGSVEPGTSSIVMQDDFDASVDASMWTTNPTTGSAFGVGTTCGTISSGNSLYSNGGTAAATSKEVSVPYGGTISFYMRIPQSSGGGCTAPNSTNDDLYLQYSTNGTDWEDIVIYQENNSAYGTAAQYQVTIPDGAKTANTRFRWTVVNGDGGINGNQDEWAIDDVVISALDTPPTTQILEDNFDPSIDGADWASTTGMTVGTTCGAAGTGNSLTAAAGSGQAETIDLDLQHGGIISFNVLIPDGGACPATEDGDEVQLQYSVDGGAFTELARYEPGPTAYRTATQVSAVLPPNVGASSIRLRWAMPGASSGNDSWVIDDVSVDVFGSVMSLTGDDRVVYSTLLSQPQVAQYSRMIDTDTDVFPNTWLMNGIDNSIGARWSARYRSMHDLDTLVNPNEDCGTSGTMAQMSSWGQDTNFGNVSLGKVETYTPKNSSGGNINCARYYYFFVEIDASQSFGYPEDISRGPTITDLTLFFTSDPSKRLRHGKTFTGGEQQPLDTPCRYPTSGGLPDLNADPNRNNCSLPEDD